MFVYKVQVNPIHTIGALTHYHTMPHFEAPKIYSCGKHCEKRRNCLEQAISLFLTMFSTWNKQFLSFSQCFPLGTSNFSLSHNVFHLEQTISLFLTMFSTWNKQFLSFSQCFPPYMVLIFHFNCTLKCSLQFVSIWTSLKLLWEKEQMPV